MSKPPSKYTLELLDKVIKENHYKFTAEDAQMYCEKRQKHYKSVQQFLKKFNESILECIRRYNSKAGVNGEPKLWKTIDTFTTIGHRLATNARPYKRPKPKPKVAKPKKEKHPWIPYEEQLKDQRWYAFRKKVFALKGHKCALCGTTENLQVHHPKYSGDYSKYAWEYDPKYMVVLCYDCHMKIHEALERNKSQAS